MNRINALVVLAGWVLTLCAYAETPIADLRQQLNFDSWPNKQGPRKPGFIFNKGDYPQFSGYEISKDSVGLKEEPNIKFSARDIVLKKDNLHVLLHIACFKSNSEAQEHLINTANSYSKPIRVRDQPGIGDVSLLGGILFVRNNITISTSGPDAALLVGVAAAIDTKIANLADHSEQQFNDKLPALSNITATPGRILINVRDSSKIALTVDGKGLEIIKRVINCPKQLALVSSDTIEDRGTTGTFTVKAAAINEALLWGDGTVAIEVSQ